MRLPLCFFALAAIAAPSAAADPARYMPAELIAETTTPAPGSTILIGFRMAPRPGWHGYWSNPGDSGIAPTVEWSAPAGVSFGPLLHPAPTLISADGIASYVHEGPHILLSRMTIPRGIALGTPLPIEAKLNWAACTATQCVPLRGTFRMELVAGDGTTGPERQSLSSAAANLPRAALNGRFTTSGKSVSLLLPDNLRPNPRTVRFFPDRNDAFDTSQSRATIEGGQVAITAPGHPDEQINGVVSDGRRSYRLSFTKAEATASPEESAAAIEPVEVEQRPPAVHASPAPSAQRVAPARPAPDAPDRSWAWLAMAALLGAIGATLAWRRRQRS